MRVSVDELKRRLPPPKQILSDLFGVKWRGDRAKCPRAVNHAHGDRNPSFGYLSKENRFQCFAQHCFGPKPVDVFDLIGQMNGWSFDDVLTSLSERYAISPPGNQAKSSKARPSVSGRDKLAKEGWVVVAEYAMGDDVRKVRLQHPQRLQAGKNRPEKTFLWEHREADGEWKRGRGDKPHQAYVNTVLRDRDEVEAAVGVESERSADALAKYGVAAFSFKELTPENAVALAGLNVRLLPDKDAAGAKLVRRAVDLLRSHAQSIALIDPPGDWPEAGDIYDAINEMQWGQDRVESLLATAKPIESDKAKPEKDEKSGIEIWTLASLRAAHFEPRQPIVEDIIAEGEIVALVGKPKAGKSRLAQQLALAVSRGESLLGFEVAKARRVLILDLENRAAGVRARFQKMSRGADGDERIFIFAPETLSDGGVTLATPNGIKALHSLVAKWEPDLIIIDTWRLLLAGDENKTEVVVRGLRILSSLRRLRPTLAILVVHHTRKTQGQDPPLLRIDPSAWVENASGHYALVAHVDACFGLEREVDRKTGDELIVFGGVSRSAPPNTLLLDDDPTTLLFKTAESEEVIQKLLTKGEREAWQRVESLREFRFTDVIEITKTKNRKLVTSMLRKLTSMKVLEHSSDGMYRKPADKRN